MAFTPLRHDHGKPIEDELAEARVILGQIVDLGLRSGRWRTRGRRFAIEIGGAARFKTERCRRVADVEAIERNVACVTFVVERDQAQRVVAEIARVVDANFHVVVTRRIALGEDSHGCGLHVLDPAATRDSNIRRRHLLGRLAEEKHL